MMTAHEADLWHDPETLYWPSRELCFIPMQMLINGVIDEYTKSEDILLELGSGTGALDDYTNYSRQTKYVEGSEELIAVHRAKLTEEGKDPDSVIQGDLYELPFEDNSVDNVVGLLVLDAMLDLPAAVQEIHRVLKPGGKFIYFHDLRASSNAMALMLYEQGAIPIPIVDGRNNITHMATFGATEFKWLKKQLKSLVPKSDYNEVVDLLESTNQFDIWQHYPEVTQPITKAILNNPELQDCITPHVSELLSMMLQQEFEATGMKVLENNLRTSEVLVDRSSIGPEHELLEEHNTIEHGAFGNWHWHSEDVLPGKVLLVANVLTFVATK